MLVIPLCLPDINKYKNVSQNTTALLFYELLPLGYMFRLTRVIITPSKEQVQCYLSVSYNFNHNSICIITTDMYFLQ
jgi:hypothetical protein